MMNQKKQSVFRSIVLTALLSVGTLFLPGCAASQPAASGTTASTASGKPARTFRFEMITPVSIASAFKTRNEDTAKEMLDGFDWFYDEYMDRDLSLESIPKGAVPVTDPSRLDGEWIVTHYRHPDDDWQKQILTAELHTNGRTVSYTENWMYIFFKDGTLQDARTAAHDLPYSGTVENDDPLTVDLTEEYFDNILTYFNFFEYNGNICAIGTYYSDFDQDLGFAGMYKASETPTATPAPTPVVTEKPKTEPAKTEQTGSKTDQNVTDDIPETVAAPDGLEFLEDTWKGSDRYFTIRFLDDGRLNFIQYSLEPLGDDTGFGGMDAHYMTNTYCEYTFDRSNSSVSFSDGTDNLVIERGSGDSLRVITYKGKQQSGETVVSRAESPTVFVKKN